MEVVEEDGRIRLEDVKNYLEDTITDEMQTVGFYEQKLKLIPKLEELERKRERGERLTEAEAREAMAITCYGNIAYCCGIQKKCPFRDVALRALGITLKEYRKKKEEKLWDILRELGVVEEKSRGKK